MGLVPHRRSPAVLLLLAALLGTPAPPAAADGGAGAGAHGAAGEVARLYADASAAAGRYADGRRALAAQQERVRGIEERLARRRHRTAALRGDLGRIARAQYREGGDLPGIARMLAADSPDELLRGQHAVREAGKAVRRAVDAGAKAQRGLARERRRAVRARRGLERRAAELAGLREGITRRLDAARQRLQGEAERSVAAGRCPAPVRLDQGAPPVGPRWVAPVEGYALSAGFDSEGAHWASRHTGQDFAVDIGTPVRAAADGLVVRVSCGGAFGMQVLIRHPDGVFTQYAHLSSVAVAEGERVAAGRWIAQSGSTGNSTGPHLHFEVRTAPDQGSAVDPVPWLAGRGVVV